LAVVNAVQNRRAELEALDLTVEHQKEFLKHVTLEQEGVLARRRVLIDELDLFDNSGSAAHTTDRFGLLL